MKNYSYLVNRHFMVNKKRMILTIIGIISSMILFFTIGYINHYLQEAYLLESIERFGNYQVIINDVDKKNVEKLINNINVDKCGAYKYEGQSEIIKDNGRRYLDVYKLDKVSMKEIFKDLIVIQEGRLPNNKKEIILPYQVKSNLNISIGSDVTINNKNYKVVGLYDEKGIYGGNVHTGLTYLENINDEDSVDLIVRVNENNLNFNDIKGIITDSGINFSEAYNIGDIQFNNAFIQYGKLEKYEQGMYINEEALTFAALNLVVLILTIILTYGSINISLNERKKQFATLRCIGATPSKIKALLIKESFLLGLYSIIPGILIAQIISWIITYTLVNKSMNINVSELNFKIYIDVILSTVLLIIINIVFATIIPVIKVGKLSPIEVLRNKGKVNDTITNRKSKLIRKLFGYSGELAYKNIRANKKSFIITITTLSIILIAIAGFTGYNTFNARYLNERIMSSSDIYISSSPSDINVEEEYTLNALIKYSDKFVEGVKNLNVHSELYAYTSIRLNLYLKENDINKNLNYDNYHKIRNENGEKYLDFYNINLLILDNGFIDRLLPNIKSNGKNVDKFNSDDFILVSNKDQSQLFNDNNVNLYFDYDTNKEEPIVPINMNYVGTIDKKKLKGLNRFNHADDLTIIVSKDFTSRIKNEINANLSSSVKIAMDLDKRQNYERSIELINEYTSKYYAHVDEERLNEVKGKESVDAFYTIVYIGLALIILISAINLINTRSIDIKLREKEFKILLAVGMKKSNLKKMIFLEGIIAWFISTLIGGTVSLAILIVLKVIYLYVYKLEDVSIPYEIVAIGIVIILIISLLTSSIPYRKFKNIDLNDLMKEDE